MKPLLIHLLSAAPAPASARWLQPRLRQSHNLYYLHRRLCFGFGYGNGFSYGFSSVSLYLFLSLSHASSRCAFCHPHLVVRLGRLLAPPTLKLYTLFLLLPLRTLSAKTMPHLHTTCGQAGRQARKATKLASVAPQKLEFQLRLRLRIRPQDKHFVDGPISSKCC